MISYGTQTCHKIGELSQVASARRAGNELSRKLGFNEIKSGQLAIIITEAGTNIGKHADSGYIFMRSLEIDSVSGIEVIAVDAGPGMDNPSRNFEDGNSSTGTYGVGLGAIKRLAHSVDIFSERGKGTVMSITIWNSNDAPKHSWQVGGVCLPLASEDISGDSWKICPTVSGLQILIADGLGHGPQAAEASLLAVKTLESNPESNPTKLLRDCHTNMKGSRGAALAVANIDFGLNTLRYIGVGNIAGSIFSESKRQHLLSHNGIVGSNMHKTQEFVHEWTENAMLIMHSDGIGTKWDLSNYQGLDQCHPSVIAAVIYRDHTRVRDDSTIVVLKHNILCQ